MPTVQVLEVKSVHEKVNQATLQGGKVVKWWKDSAFNDKLANGVTVDMKVETKPARNNPDTQETWVLEVDGVGAKAKFGGGGGGGFKSAPKSREEIHSASVCGVIKSCIEAAMDTETAQKYIELYHANIGRYA